MEGSASSINSRSTAIKTILLVAWRAKLSDEEWEARIRKVLPRGVNGDVYDLADCLLKQALVGPVPNRLFISYLKHAVKCELVSHCAVISSIAHQINIIRTPSAYNPVRTSSLICLLDFLKTFRDRILCKGNEIECLNLCHSLLQLIHWLLKCIQNSLDLLSGTLITGTNSTLAPISALAPSSSSSTSSLATNININNQATVSSFNPNTNVIAQNTPVNQSSANNESILAIIDLCTETIQYFISRPYTKSLLFISKIEYITEFDDMLKELQVIQQKLSSCQQLQFIQDKVQHYKVLHHLDLVFNSREMHPAVIAAQQLRCLQYRIKSAHITTTTNMLERNSILQQTKQLDDSTTNYALFNSLYSLVAFDVILRPARSHKLLARQLAIITSFNSANVDVTYCELIRVCMIGLIDTEGTSAKVKWAFFSYLKMPKLLIELSKAFKNYTTNTSHDVISPNDFIRDLKLAFERLREYSPLLDEAEYKCNCDFFKCLVKELIKNEPNLNQLKNIDLPVKRMSASNNDVGGHLMLKTDPFVTSMLQTFNSEQDPVELFSLLSQFVSGKQFEFTLSCAASTGRLHMFVKKLIEYNESNRIPSNDLSKNQEIRSLIFDITFLILTYIAQQYGPEVIGTDQQPTFNKWFYDCYNPNTRINCPKEMLKHCDSDLVTSLIKQIVLSDAGGIQMKSVNWCNVCQSLPRAINDILVAWNQNFLNDNDLRDIMEKIKSKMCFLAVVAATWLQCYIRTLNSAERVKPLSLLHNLTKASQFAKQQKQMINDSCSKGESYPERSSLMCSIIRKIYFELVPRSTNNSSSTSNQNCLNSNIPHNPNNNGGESEESSDASAYLSVNDKFISTLTTQEIFMANVKQCLNRGWIGYKSLNSLSSLFKMIGSDCFTNLLVEQILTSHESPSDLSRAVNITFGLFHLDIEACAFSLLKSTIPSWLMGEKKQVLLNQPRAFALAHLTVITIVEVYTSLESKKKLKEENEAKRISAVKQEQNSSHRPLDGVTDLSAANSVKRMKLSLQENEQDVSFEELGNQEVLERFEKLNSSIADLMRLFKEIMSDTIMSQRTFFPVMFLQQTVVCTREGSSAITVHLQPEILLDIINLFSSDLTFELVLAISNLSSTNSRRYAAKAMCQLAQVKELKQNQLVASKSSISLSSGVHSNSGSTNHQQSQTAINTMSTTNNRSTSMVVG